METNISGPDQSATAIDLPAFQRDLDALRAEINEGLGPADVAHLRKIELWGRLCSLAGYATAWIVPNPISAVLLAVGNSTRWAVMMHHVGHRGIDRAAEKTRAQGGPVPTNYSSKLYAQGRRRFLDWFDWMLPQAWHHEHDFLHHYSTNELLDPDLVEENLKGLRASRVARPLKYAAVAFFALTWKVTYYAPNTFQILKRHERTRAARRAGTLGMKESLPGTDHLIEAFDLRTPDGREFWRVCLLPYAAIRFLLLPALFAPLGMKAVLAVLLNSIFAELLTNLHSFAIIAPNHAGEDIYRFATPAKGREEHHLRQIISSVNYATGGDINDWLHGYLNYQIEHHLWPDLPPLKYRDYAPRVRELCLRHGVVYLQEPLATRIRKTVDIMVGKSSMKRAREVLVPVPVHNG